MSPMSCTGMAAAKSEMRSISPRAAALSSKPVDQRLDARLQRAQRPRGERGRKQPAHPRVIGRVVEDEARRMVLVEQAVGKIRPEVEPLVRSPGVHVAIDRKAIVVAGEEA